MCGRTAEAPGRIDYGGSSDCRIKLQEVQIRFHFFLKRPILPPVIEEQSNARKRLNGLELEVLDLFGQFSKALGYPKSVGEIYGTLYLTEGSMSMADIMERLKISLGSVSQGLKVLKGLEAITVEHSDSARKDLFLAETDYGRFLSCFLKDRVQPGVQGLRERIERISHQAGHCPPASPELARRINGIRDIYGLLTELIPVVRNVLEGQK